MENNTKTLGKIVANWAQSDPLKRIILGLNIALEGAIAEESGEYPFEYAADISEILKSVWETVYERDMTKNFVTKYKPELLPVLELGGKPHFYSDGNHQPDYLDFYVKDGFTLDNYKLDADNDDALRKSIKEAAEDWTKQYKKFISGKKG